MPPPAIWWNWLLDRLGKSQADDSPLSILEVLSISGLEDALWCLRAVQGHEKEKRMLALWCVRVVGPQLTDAVSIGSLEIAEKFAEGICSEDDLRRARLKGRRQA